MSCHAMHPIQDLFLESFSYELQFDMHFYMHFCLRKSFYSCKKWVSHNAGYNQIFMVKEDMGTWPRLLSVVQVLLGYLNG
jgi:hypothetical protein